MKYTKEHARYLYCLAREYGLSGYELLQDEDAVVRDCNGVGADWMPDSLVQLCTKMVPVMEVPSAIHDRRYIVSVDRLGADTEFLSNVNKVNEITYAWWNPLRYINRKRAERCYWLLRTFGGAAWSEAKKKSFAVKVGETK